MVPWNKDIVYPARDLNASTKRKRQSEEYTTPSYRPNKQQQNKLLVMEAQQQEDGWPLGLRPLNARVGIDLDTESTGSFFHDNSLTLGSLIGVSSILELSTRSTRGRTTETSREQKNYKSKPWLFSICSRLSPDVVSTNNNAPSLGHFLRVERRAAANIHRRGMIYGPRDFSPNLPDSGVNSQFNG
ncbi:hypothetical protein OIU77_030063 [Salix suchowensis]|uniref:Uncharacterized protein n=1 Tax=Salix suchowensis TaxID=1278906 RepID=A0ABQ9BCP8_9ROSI|nr:hypothetical protein OIU77_030063 [Salix suchowensis]